MGTLYMIVGTLVALGVLVTFHEFGHFWVARRCGVKVLRFSVGFGKPLLCWSDRHGTEFVIAAIPLGGYVKMLDEREAEVPEALLGGAFNRKSVRQRFAIVSAGPLANFLLALVFFWLLAMLGSEQVRPVIGAVEAGSLAEQAGLVADEEILAVNGKRVAGWGEVNLQLVRRLGESGQLDLTVRELGASRERSYLEIVDALRQHGAAAREDIRGLWRRLVFNILVSNTDDHLRNHGFLYAGARGWKLSPAYDLNPVPVDIKPRILNTAITEDDATASLDLALEVAGYFELRDPEAREIMQAVGRVVSTWRDEASRHGLQKPQIERMASAFEHEDLLRATRS